MKSLHQLLSFLGLPTHPTHQAIQIEHLYQDSRLVTARSAFFALKGEKQDGHDFIQQAAQQGAAVIFVEHASAQTDALSCPVILLEQAYDRLGELADFFYDHPSSHLSVIGITGTNGKTSTCHYIAELLHLMGEPVGIIGTLGNGPWGNLSKTTHTTPEVLSLHRLLQDFVQSGLRYAIMEASSHALSQNRLDGVLFTSAVFTNLTRDHLDYHQTMTHYAQAKARLFSKPGLRYAVINYDDPASPQMVHALSAQTQCLLYSRKDATDPLVFAKQSTETSHEKGLCFELFGPFGSHFIQTTLLGEFNIANLQAALLCLYQLGFQMSVLAPLCYFLTSVKGRMETLRLPRFPLVVIDFAHTPDALEKALASLAAPPLPDLSLWVVFGCGGNRDPGKRPLMAEVAERYAAHLIITEDNSRMEAIEAIFEAIRQGLRHPEQAYFIPDRTEAIYFALAHAQVSDCILLAGKGHETELDKNGIKTHYDEREIVKRFASLKD